MNYIYKYKYVIIIVITLLILLILYLTNNSSVLYVSILFLVSTVMVILLKIFGKKLTKYDEYIQKLKNFSEKYTNRISNKKPIGIITNIKGGIDSLKRNNSSSETSPNKCRRIEDINDGNSLLMDYTLNNLETICGNLEDDSLDGINLSLDSLIDDIEFENIPIINDINKFRNDMKINKNNIKTNSEINIILNDKDTSFKNLNNSEKKDKIIEYCLENNIIIKNDNILKIPTQTLNINYLNYLDLNKIIDKKWENKFIQIDISDYKDILKNFDSNPLETIYFNMDWIKNNLNYLKKLDNRQILLLNSYTHFGDVIINYYLRDRIVNQIDLLFKIDDICDKSISSNNYFPFYTYIIEFWDKIEITELENYINYYTDVYHVEVNNYIKQFINLKDLIKTKSYKQAYEKCLELVPKFSYPFWNIILNNYNSDLKKIIDESPEITIPFYLYRGNQSNPFKSNNINVNDYNKYTSYGYTSTSLDLNVAQEFAHILNELDDDKKKGIIFRYFIMPGTKCLFLDPVSVHSESEILLQSNINIDMLNIERKEESQYFDVIYYMNNFYEKHDNSLLDKKDKNPKGVAFIPFHKNNNEICIMLGLEKSGPYENTLNFIGGAIDKLDTNNVWKTLEREVEEELGLHLDKTLLNECLIKNKIIENDKHITNFTFCYISNLNEKDWKKMQSYRHKLLKNELKYPYQEFSTIKSIPIKNLSNEKNLSSYVLSYINEIMQAYNEFENNKIKIDTTIRVKDFQEKYKKNVNESYEIPMLE